MCKRLLPQYCQSARLKQPIDVLETNIAYGLDFVSAYTFGISQGTNFVEDAQSRNRWLAAYLQSHPDEHMFWLVDAPKLGKWLRRCGLKVVPDKHWQARQQLEKWALQVVDRTEEALQATPTSTRTGGDFPMVYHQLKLAMAKERGESVVDAKNGLSSSDRLQLASECLDHLVATREVFGISYSFMLYYLACHPAAQHSLCQELKSLSKPMTLPLCDDASQLPKPQELDSLPLLNAMVKGPLRLRGAVPSPNPRVTQYGKETQIGLYPAIPGGVRVNSFAWCLHRNNDVFPDGEHWRPERCLGGLGDQTEQERWLWTFGSGSQRCLGDHLAIDMIHYAVALIHSNFATSVASGEGFGKDGMWVTAKPEDKLVEFKAI